MWQWALEWLKERVKWVILFSILLLAGLGFLFYPESPKEEEIFQPVTGASPKGEELEKAQEIKEIVIDLKGAVKKPGIYFLPEGSRLYEAIEKAGGYHEDADVNQVNGAQLLRDGEGIYIPFKGEEGILPVQGMKGKVNINKATEEELQTLSGIGPSKAKAIIQYREEHGGFKNIEEIKKIGGIGDKTFEKIKGDITT